MNLISLRRLLLDKLILKNLILFSILSLIFPIHHGMGESSTNNLYFGLGETYSGASIPLSHLAQGSRLHITLLQHIYSFILLESFIEQNNIEKWQYHAEL